VHKHFCLSTVGPVGRMQMKLITIVMSDNER
jgi:hypothetical protein